MTQRTLAGILAVPLLIGLWVVAAFEPLPYVTYEPGLTINVLGTNDDGDEIIQVEGHKAYRDDGELRMTTVYVSQRDAHNTIFELMHDWISRDAAVYPKDAIYQKGGTVEEDKQEGQVEMTSSQDAATAVALNELGYRVTESVVTAVNAGSPAEGRLDKDDVILRVDGDKVLNATEVVAAVQAADPGEPVAFVVRRHGERQRVSVTPDQVDGGPQVGVSVATKTTDFPFKVTVGISSRIGGPSAGLMFSLGIYDTLTPGSMTGGDSIAGTGTIDADGNVGPIGGIQQKIAGARNAGAQLFLVPADNCDEAVGAPNGDMRLAKVTTMHSALESIQAWVADPDAELPTCKGESS